MNAVPQWVQDAVFYQIFPDRFAQSAQLNKPPRLEAWDAPPTERGFKGGDLYGVVEKLDYLQDLGITALYLNPVFASAANHRYHTYDYERVDPLLGGDDALRTLLDRAHERDMKVVLDGVFNHASRGFFAFHHLLENGAKSPYLDWFHVKGFPLRAYATNQPPNYDAWWGLPALPKFNVAHPDVREYLWHVATRWIEFGIDGWRLDVPEEIDDPEFWREFRRRVRAITPEAYLVGEIWHRAPDWLAGDRFDAVMNYPFARALLGFVLREPPEDELVAGTGYAPIPDLDAPAFAAEIDELMSLYAPEVTQAQLNLLDSHDTARFRTLARGDASAFKLATLLQMTMPGAPCVYYGDEIGLEGRRDPDCRRAFPWEANRWDHELRDYVKSCIALRREHPALRRGKLRCLFAGDAVYAFGRRTDDETLVVVVNTADAPRSPSLNASGYLDDGRSLRDVGSDDGVVVRDGHVDIDVAPRSGRVLRAC
mgnify:CR=1 FL=1